MYKYPEISVQTALTAPGAAVSWPRALPLDLARARPVIFGQSQMLQLAENNFATSMQI